MKSVVGIIACFCLLLAAVIYVTADVSGDARDVNEEAQELSRYKRRVISANRRIKRQEHRRPGRLRRPGSTGHGHGRVIHVTADVSGDARDVNEEAQELSRYKRRVISANRRRERQEHRRPGRGRRPGRTGHGHGRGRGRGRNRGGAAAGPRAQRLMRALSTAQYSFTSSLHSQIGRPETNVVYSPYSIHHALTMAYLGARTQTAIQMKRVLALQGLGRRAHRANMRLSAMMNDPGNATLETANALYVKAGVTLERQFSIGLTSYYNSSISMFDWQHQDGPEGPINEWVSAKTHTLIPTILTPGTITQMTAMVILNAIYFKATWKHPFAAEMTTQRMFSQTATEQVPVQMMEIEKRFKIGVVPGLAARLLELPYEGDRFSMLVMLPDSTDGITTLEEGLTAEILAMTLDTVMPATAKVFLPRFKLESALSLKTSLRNMGMVKAFDAGMADFSGINGNNDLYIADVIHRAVVDVNEEGSEAAGATAVIFGLRSFPRQTPEFRCDHPFLFIIRDNVSKVNLFVGKFSGGA